MISKKEIPQWKLEEIDYLIDQLKNNKTIAIIDVRTVRDKQIQEIRKVLREKAVIRMSKKNLQIRAIEQYKKESNKSNLDDLVKNIPGQSALVFTNLNAYELKKIFSDNVWRISIKPDSITPIDVWVLAGDTGLPTGQVISELNMTLKLPTRIQNDTIWIREDTKTHKAGDFVDVKQAAVLKKLGIKPIESTIKIFYAWHDGEIIPSDVLYMDMEAFQRDFLIAYFTAKKLAIELEIVDKETIEPMIQKAYREAIELLFETSIFDTSMTENYVKKAVTSANALNSIIFGGTTTPEKEK